MINLFLYGISTSSKCGELEEKVHSAIDFKYELIIAEFFER